MYLLVALIVVVALIAFVGYKNKWNWPAVLAALAAFAVAIWQAFSVLTGAPSP